MGEELNDAFLINNQYEMKKWIFNKYEFASNSY